MGWRLAATGDALETGFIKRFDPQYWTVNFPRPMLAAVTNPAPDALRIDATFLRRNDLAGIIWAAADDGSHPLLAYETARDFRGCRLRFRWRSAGVAPLDAVHGPVMTIEGRDAAGHARAWYVRLWNYAEGGPDDAVVTLDFAGLESGFALPGEAVWAGDIDRLFLSLVPPGYDPASDAPLPAPAEGWAEISAIACDGPGSVLAIGEGLIPGHGMRIATGYDDLYHLTPARVLRSIRHLGYRGAINHYVGMSHYMRLGWDGAAGAYLAGPAGGAIAAPCAAWHRDFAARAWAQGQDVIWSLSYELLDQNCPDAWKQRAENSDPARTGWDPPSTLLSPAHGGAMAYLRAVAEAFVDIAADAGMPVRFQIGEPWWWVMPGDGRICLYDPAARAALGGDPPSIPDVRGALDAGQRALLDQAGALLAASTAALRDAVKARAPGAEVLILIYLPTVLDRAAPELKRANVPLGWARPAFDRLQLEDYDWVTAGDAGSTARGIAEASARLDYPVEEQHYFAGFVLRPEDRRQWRRIHDAAFAAKARGTADVFVWALPQVQRDGFTLFVIGDEEAAVQAFDDVDFPVAIGARATVEPGFSTAIVTTSAGREQRNADWADARMRYDVGPGVLSRGDLEALIAFFRARYGAARGFRFRDPTDDSSRGMTDEPGFADQPIGTGDGIATRFPLAKHYGDQVRRITRPAAGSVRVGVDGVARANGWSLAEGGVIAFDEAPATGAAITAGFRFDVPVRFAEDRLEAGLAGFAAGEAASVPLIEIREGEA
ncbi:DUF2460 domain-containing protein [Sphingomonas fennica]|uniref:TIGR02217 family protein n=1 Tax=Edaphosphingomonas fennica TaxID=114404 RepID=A0A2T4HMG0_9SPHN|nr:DUF2460 domain-containing protein [Sphingomonas fennica]PTD16975.1 TIGR02217 family protein [Sphingomonas fennica]